MDDLSGWALVVLGVIAAIQGWATFGPWLYRKAYPAKFEVTFGEGVTTVTRKSGSVETVTVRLASKCKRHITARQIFFLFSEALELQGFRLAGIPMTIFLPPPVIHMGPSGRFRTVGAPTPLYFSKDDAILFDFIFRFPAAGDYVLRSQVWADGEEVVLPEPLRINVSPP